MIIDECIYYDHCVNAEKSCFQCFNYNMYREQKKRQGLRPRSLQNKQLKKGIDFENRGTKKYNAVLNQAKDAARRQIASGSLHFALGDMITEEELTASLAEFKERGQKNSRGEKNITIKKEWLDALEKEAREMGKDYYFLPFSFKGSNKDYVAMDYDILLSYVQTIQVLNEYNKKLVHQIENYLR